MHVHGTRHAGLLTKVPNATARDHALSYTARALLAYMLSLPDGAREDVKTLANKSAEGRSAASRTLHELESRGYLARIRFRDGEGRTSTRVDVFADREGASAQVVPATVAPGRRKQPPRRGRRRVPSTQDPEAGSGGEPQGREGGEPSRAAVLLELYRFFTHP